MLYLVHFGLERQGQVGQVEFAWFRRSRGSSWRVLGRGSGGGGRGTRGRRRAAVLGSKLAEQVPPGFLVGGVELDAGGPLRGGRGFLASKIRGSGG